MTTFARVYDLYVNVDAPGGAYCLLDASGAKRSDSEKVSWVASDIFELRIHFRRLPTTIDGVLEVIEQPASWAIVLAALDPADATKMCFSATSFVRVATTDDVYYSATLSLDTANLTTALAAVDPGESLEFCVDIENQDATNAARLTYQFPVLIYQQVYDGETVPTPEEPQYPSPGAIMVKIGSSVALTAAQDYVEISGLGCATVPNIIVCTVRKPSGGANIWATVVHSSITADGFRADLSGSPPAAGYYLDYIIIL